MKPGFVGRPLWPTVLAVIVFVGVATACQRATEPASTASGPTAVDTAGELAATETAQLATTTQISVAHATATQQVAQATATPSATAASAASATPEATSAANWLVPAVRVSPWPADLWRFEWTDAQTLIVFDGYSRVFGVDTATGALEPVASATPSATPDLAVLQLSSDADVRHSPDGLSVLVCDSTRYLFYQRGTSAAIAELEVESNSSCAATAWSPNSRAVAVFVPGQGVHILRADGQKLYKPLQSVMGNWPLWAPDSSRLLVFELLPSGDSAAFHVAFPDERPLLELGYHVAGHWEIGGGTHFYNDTLFSNYQGCGFLCGWTDLIDTDTGKIAATWGSQFSAIQEALPSPNLRWLATDSTSEIPGHFYEIFDLETRQSWKPYFGEEAYLQFVGWSRSGSEFYAVSLPISATSPAPSGLPFGLLKLNPVDESIDLVLGDAVYASLSPNSELMWVVFSIPGGSTPSLEASMVDLKSGEAGPRVPVAGSSAFWNPAEETLVPAVWSADGQSLVYWDRASSLWLARSDGSVHQLANRVVSFAPGPAYWNFSIGGRILWSPDEQRLLFYTETEAWIVSLPD